MTRIKQHVAKAFVGEARGHRGILCSAALTVFALTALVTSLAAIVLVCAVSVVQPRVALAADSLSIPLTVEKRITGSTPTTDSTFTFVLEAETDDAPMPEGTAGSSAELQIVGASTESFGNIDFSGYPAGQYQYKLTERNDGIAGYTYDTTVYHILVDVSYINSDLKTQVIAWRGETRSEDTKVSELVFTNAYSSSSPTPAPSEKTLSVVVVWENEDEAAVVARPEAVTVVLYRNGTVYDRRTVYEADNWWYTWTNLEEGVTWTLEENPVPSGYTAAVEFFASGETPLSITDILVSGHPSQTGSITTLGLLEDKESVSLLEDNAETTNGNSSIPSASTTDPNGVFVVTNTKVDSDNPEPTPPDNPDDPNNPDDNPTPNDSGNPTDNSTDSPSNIPEFIEGLLGKTGDMLNWLPLVALAALAIIIVARIRHNRGKQHDEGTTSS